MALTTAAVFPFGVFEDANIEDGNAAAMLALVQAVQTHGLNSICFAKNNTPRDAALPGVTEQYGLRLIWALIADLAPFYAGESSSLGAAAVVVNPGEAR